MNCRFQSNSPCRLQQSKYSRQSYFLSRIMPQSFFLQSRLTFTSNVANAYFLCGVNFSCCIFFYHLEHVYNLYSTPFAIADVTLRKKFALNELSHWKIQCTLVFPSNSQSLIVAGRPQQTTVSTRTSFMDAAILFFNNWNAYRFKEDQLSAIIIWYFQIVLKEI